MARGAAQALGYVAATAGFVAASIAFPLPTMLVGLAVTSKAMFSSDNLEQSSDENISRLYSRCAVLVPGAVGLAAASLVPGLDSVGGAMLGGALACALPAARNTAKVPMVTVKILESIILGLLPSVP